MNQFQHQKTQNYNQDDKSFQNSDMMNMDDQYVPKVQQHQQQPQIEQQITLDSQQNNSKQPNSSNKRCQMYKTHKCQTLKESQAQQHKDMKLLSKYNKKQINVIHNEQVQSQYQHRSLLEQQIQNLKQLYFSENNKNQQLMQELNQFRNQSRRDKLNQRYSQSTTKSGSKQTDGLIRDGSGHLLKEGQGSYNSSKEQDRIRIRELEAEVKELKIIINQYRQNSHLAGQQYK